MASAKTSFGSKYAKFVPPNDMFIILRIIFLLFNIITFAISLFSYLISGINILATSSGPFMGFCLLFIGLAILLVNSQMAFS